MTPRKRARTGDSLAKKKEESDIRGIVRIAGKDVKGHLPIYKALYQIRGVGLRYAKVVGAIVERELNVSMYDAIGRLSDEQLEAIENIIRDPLSRNVPVWILNRRRDFESGKDLHLIMNDLTFAVKQDIEREKKLKTWRGISHMYRKKVRGQRTRTTGRKGRTVGVVRRKQQPGKK